MSACLAQQEPLKVGYLGPEGTFTQQAVLKHFGHSVRALPLDLGRGSVPRGARRARRFRRGADRELDRRHGQQHARHVPDVAAEDLRRGRAAHPPEPDGPHDGARTTSSASARIRSRWRSAAAGCDEHLPDVERVPVSSNAEGARRARDEEGTAAIAGAAAAEVYGLNMLVPEIEDRADNTTRFLVIGRKLFNPSGDDKTTLLVLGRAHRCAGRAVPAARAARAARDQHDAHRVAAVAQAQVGLRVLHRLDGHAEREPLARRSPSSRRARRCSACWARIRARSSEAGMSAYHRRIRRTASPGDITVPGDKSISHRALMLGAIAEGTTHVDGFLESEDCLATHARARAARCARCIDRRPGRVERATAWACTDCARRRHRSTWAIPARRCGCSWGCSRAQAFDSVLVGDASLMRRPMERVAQPLRAMGARIDTDGGRPPVANRRRRASAAASATSCRVASAQVKSALLLAGLYAEGTTTVDRAGASRAITPSACCRASAASSTQPRRRDRRCSRRRDCEARAIACRRLLLGRVLHRRRLHRGARAAHDRDVGINPTRTGLLEILR